MQSKKNVVVIGGGTGTYSVLSGLKAYPDKVDLTAVVAMSDDGSSTGRLRDEFGILPVGDVRMALLALSDEARIDNQSLRALFSYRFVKGGEGLQGHNFGNLLLVALSEILGSELSAIAMVSRLLGVQGKVLPVTTDSIFLAATYDDGLEVVGESIIDNPPKDRGDHGISDLRVVPEATVCPEVCTALAEADYIVLGPGDLYTSLLAAVVVGDLSVRIRNAKGKFVFVGNLMSKFGQTTGYTTEKYISEIQKYIGRVPDAFFINTTPFPESALLRYIVAGEHPVLDTGSGTEATRVIRGDFVGTEEVRGMKGDTHKRSLVRHDAQKLSEAFMDYLGGVR